MFDRTRCGLSRLVGIAALLFLALIPAVAKAQVEVYPDTDIQTVVDGYPAGTTFLLKSGVHRMQQVRPRNGDTFIGESGTVLNGSRVLAEFDRSWPYWSADNQTQQGQPIGMCDTDSPRCVHPEQLFINDRLLKHVSSLDDVVPGTWFFDYDADRIYLADDPAGSVVETAVTVSAFENTGDHVTVSGLTIEKYANPAQYGAIHGAGRYNWIITGNDVRLNHGTGIRVGHGTLVRGNNVHHQGQIGVGGVGDGVLVEDNEIAYNNIANFFGFWEAGGTKFAQTHNLVARGNFVHHNAGAGLWTDIDNVNTLFENNRVEDNERWGILHEISYAAVIRNNVIKRNGWRYSDWMEGAGISIGASANVEIYGNLLEGNGDGIAGAQQNRGAGVYGRHLLVNMNVHDNTLINNGGWTGVVQDIGDLAFFLSLNNRFERNHYQLGPQRYHFAWMNQELTKDQWLGFGQDMQGTFDSGAARVAPLDGSTIAVSDMAWTFMSNGWGDAERDRSNGESGAADGRTLALDGTAYAKGSACTRVASTFTPRRPHIPHATTDTTISWARTLRGRRRVVKRRGTRPDDGPADAGSERSG